jgi:hypothetical protein
MKKEKKRPNGMSANILSAFFLLSDDKVSVIFWFLQIIFCFSDFKRWQPAPDMLG